MSLLIRHPHPIRMLAAAAILVVTGPCATGTAIAQSVTSATLDSEGVDIQFSSRNDSVEVYAINLAALGRLEIDASGRARLDLSQIAPPQGRRACFFARNLRSGELISFSRSTGFYNPFWEQRSAADVAPRPPRSIAAVDADLAQLDRDVTEAKAHLEAERGKRYRDERCQNATVSERPRPAFAIDGANGRYYAAVRCGALIGKPPLTCSAVVAASDLTDDPAFRAPVCNDRLRAAQTLISGKRDRAGAERHTALVAAVSAAAGTRQIKAQQCIDQVATASANDLADWRNERDRSEASEAAAMNACTAAVGVLADADVRMAELQRERAAPRPPPGRKSAVPKPPSRNARDYPCPLQAQ